MKQLSHIHYIYGSHIVYVERRRIIATKSIEFTDRNYSNYIPEMIVLLAGLVGSNTVHIICMNRVETTAKISII